MSETQPETTTTEPSPPVEPPRDWGRMGLILSIAAAVVLLLWLAVSVRLANNRAQKDSVDRASFAFAMTALPLLDMNSKGQIMDSSTLQRVCDDMVGQSSPYSLAVLIDGEGKIIACSDRKFAIGTKWPDFKEDSTVVESTQNGWQAVRPATRGTVRYGSVVLRLR